MRPQPWVASTNATQGGRRGHYDDEDWMPATKSMPKPVRDSLALERSGTVENAPQAQPRAYARGERVVVTKGDLVPVHDETMDLPGRSAQGDEVVVLGEAYESLGGSNRGEVIQQCKNPRTGALMGVPVGRLRRRQGERSARTFSGWEARARSAAEALADRQRLDEEWVEVSPGRRVLRSTTTTKK